MKIFNRLGVSTLVLTSIFAVTVTPVSANMYQEQSQSSWSQSSVSSEGTGSYKTEMNTSSSLDQSQSQGMGSSHKMSNNSSYGRKHNKNKNWNDTSGEVKIEWDHRGGTCHVRYSESSARSYKYSTSAACDNGGLTISGLQTGKRYRFQVKKDDGSWSRPFSLRAE